MKCPFCDCPETKVIDSRESDDLDSVRRRRECENTDCAKRFTTYEHFELSINVIKKDGSSESFDREKILKGLRMSCHKLPVSSDALNELVNGIERELLDEGSSDVLASKIGYMVMKRLKTLNKVAFIRFASVYQEFESVDEFKNEILKLETRKKKVG